MLVFTQELSFTISRLFQLRRQRENIYNSLKTYHSLIVNAVLPSLAVAVVAAVVGLIEGSDRFPAVAGWQVEWRCSVPIVFERWFADLGQSSVGLASEIAALKAGFVSSGANCTKVLNNCTALTREMFNLQEFERFHRSLTPLAEPAEFVGLDFQFVSDSSAATASDSVR